MNDADLIREEYEAALASDGSPGPLWRRILWPTSNWPCRYTRRAWFWHPWHVGAFFARLRMRYWIWRGY